MQTDVGYRGIVSNMFGEISNRAWYNAIKVIVNSRMKDESKHHYTFDRIANL